MPRLPNEPDEHILKDEYESQIEALRALFEDWPAAKARVNFHSIFMEDEGHPISMKPVFVNSKESMPLYIPVRRRILDGPGRLPLSKIQSYLKQSGLTCEVISGSRGKFFVIDLAIQDFEAKIDIFRTRHDLPTSAASKPARQEKNHYKTFRNNKGVSACHQLCAHR